MQIIRTVDELKKIRDNIRKDNKMVGLVPTMGALHHGHLTLVEKAVADNDIAIVSVFVNPTQFNNPDDLVKYPRTEAEDFDKLRKAGVDFVFAPSVEEVYPEPDTRQFNLGEVAEVMEGKMRPGHFNGVAQIVSKLFEWTDPTVAYFGEKDFQQIAVIKKLLELGDFKVRIVECPIDREDDGLARSSRNVRLTEGQRKVAPKIYATLKESLKWMQQGLTPKEVINKVTETLSKNKELEPEYYEIVDSVTLQPIESWEDAAIRGAYPIGCIAVYCGDVRLIDNIKYIE